MTDTITLTGFVATEPKALTTTEGLAITSFRLASNQRRFDKAQEKWIDGETNWYTVTAFRQLATNVAVSVHKGDRVVVSGKLKLREYTNKDDKKGLNVDIEAEVVGHDLFWGTAAFSRSGGTTASSSDAVVTNLPGVGQPSFPTDAELAAQDDAPALAAIGEAPF